MSETPFVEPSLGLTAGLRGTVLGFGPDRMAVVVQPYGPVNLGAPTDTYTVELWIRANPTQTLPDGVTQIPLVVWGNTIDPGSVFPYSIYLSAQTGALFALRATASGATHITALPPGGSLLDGRFHHLALVRSRIEVDGTTKYTLQVFIDGETDPTWRRFDTYQSVDASAPADAPLLFGGAVLYVSADTFDNAAFTGEMSQVRVWRGGLTREQLDAVRYEALRGPIDLWNLTPTFAAGTMTCEGTNGTIIDAGTRLMSTSGVEYATIEDVTISGGSATAAVVALVAGPDGDLPQNSMWPEWPGIPGVDDQTITPMTGGSVGDGSEPATGWLQLTNTSSSYDVTVSAGTLLGVDATGPFFTMLSGYTIDAGNEQGVPIRALTAGSDGNVAGGEITWIDPEGLTWSDPSASNSDLVLHNWATANGQDAVTTTVASGQVTFTNTGQEMAIVQVGTLVGPGPGGPLFQVTEQLNIPAGEDATADIVAVGAGEEYNLDADAIIWISPLYLVPATAKIASSTATTGGLDPHKTCVGCWCMDEGFGEVVFNYAAPRGTPQRRGDPDTYKGDGTFDIRYPGLLERIRGQDADFTAPAGAPVWKVSTLMAPPAFIQSAASEV
ncbi:MAG: baseplate J/gp47 family protein [Alphaproteobacteria bacterium]|nr:baseplate J/gp47 family protein [Alphaproteobacteria bacterium]